MQGPFQYLLRTFTKLVIYGMPRSYIWMLRMVHKKDEYIQEVYSTRKHAIWKIRCLRWEGYSEHLELVKHFWAARWFMQAHCTVPQGRSRKFHRCRT